MKKYNYFKNITKNSADFYVYGEIVDEVREDFWTGEKSETAIDTNTMKKELDDLKNKGIKEFNIYINSPGGSVFASSTIVSMLKRFKQEAKVQINSYIDGLCASAATYLLMVADKINVYKNSMLMIHKPMTISFGNANDLQKDIDTLDTIENDMMIPLYLNKSKVDADQLKDLINEESWFTGNENSEMFIGNFFDINYLDEEKPITASISKTLFKNYKNIPEELLKDDDEEYKSFTNEKEEDNKEQPKQQDDIADEVVEEVKEEIDYTEYDDIISSLKKKEE